MIDHNLCPLCGDGELTKSEGQLEQCGATFLPTLVWRCTHCGYTRYDPALKIHWRSLHPAGESVTPVSGHQHDQRKAA